MSGNDWRNCDRTGSNTDQCFSGRGIQEALGKADPAGTKACGICGEHQVLGGKRTVLGNPWTLRTSRNQNQDRSMIENVKIWIANH